MGKRLSKIYTRTGDDGTTGLGDGARVPKTHLRVDAYGTVDELNSAIGVVLACRIPIEISRVLELTQHHLFDLGGELCIPGHTIIDESHVEGLESALDQLNESLPPLEDFILPGGGPAAAACHLARTVCRRAERCCWVLIESEPDQEINPMATRYLNRLSDLLFVMARHLARHEGGAEVLWRHHRGDGEAV